MKVRITDLMDNYFDDSIHLIPPEKLPDRGSIKEEAPLMEQKHPRGLQKGLLIAASIMLVLTAAAALALGFFHWNASPTPVALADGGDTTYSAEEPEAPEEAEPAAMETQPPSPTPGLSDEISPYLMEQLDSALLTYTQRGDQLEFLFTLSPLTQETYQRLQSKGMNMWLCETENAFAPAPPEEIPDQYALEVDYNYQDQALYVRGTTTLSGSAVSFVPVILECRDDSDNNDHYFCGTPVTLTAFEPEIFPDYGWTAFDTGAFAQHSPLSLMAFPSPVDESAYCSIETVIVTAGRVSLFCTATAPSGTSVDTIADIWPLESIAQSGISLQLETADSTIDFTFSDSPIEYHLVKGTVESESLWYIYASFDHDGIDPLSIISAAFQFPEGTFDEEEPDALDDDGLLTAEIGLSFPHRGMENTEMMDTIVRLVIDPEGGTYTWYTRLFGEDPEVPESGDLIGDLDVALTDPGFVEIFTETENYLLEHYYNNAYLVFTDGTMVQIGSGDKLAHDTETMMFSEQTPLSALFEGTGIDWQSLTFDYLELCGEIYYFE